jgi:hypothetical protein
MPLPFAKERFILKPPDQPETHRTGYGDDVLPLLVTLQNIGGETPKLPSNTLVLKYIPHILNNIWFL